MGETIHIAEAAYEQLKPYLNKKGILEVAVRGKNKRFRTFPKIVFDNNSMESEAKDLLHETIKKLNKNNSIMENGFKNLETLNNLEYINMISGALNLCATCVGFAIMFSKLDKLSGQINEIIGVVKQGQDINSNYEFHKVLSNHSDMLDHRKTQKYYTDEQMRELVDNEYNVLNMLIETFLKDHTDDHNNLIVSIYSLASMMTVSLRYFDEIYYVNNKETIGSEDIWHVSHDNWTAVYDKLLSDEFVEKVQDYGMFNLGLSALETDAYYVTLNDQVKEMKETIVDNQTLITEFGSIELMSDFESYINHEVASEIEKAFSSVDGAEKNEEASEACQKAMKQMGLAI